MPVAAEFHLSEGFVKGLMIQGTLGASGGMKCEGMKAHALRVLGAAVVLAGMLSACSAPIKSGSVAVADAKEKAKDRYIHQVMEQMWKKWSYYRTQKPYDVAYGDLPVEFGVNAEGKAVNIHVRNTPKTNPDLTRFTVKAIQEAKLPPMSADVISTLRVRDEGRLKLGFIVHHLPPQEEAKRLLEKRWGMAARAREWRAIRGGEDEVSVSLTSKESGVRQVEKQPPGTPLEKGSCAGGGSKTTVKLTSTPKERYYRLATQAVEKKWNKYRMMELAGVTYGSLKVEFFVNKKGRVEDPRVVEDKESYRALTLFTLRAIHDAEIPPMPADVVPSLPMNDPERLKFQFDVLIY